MLKMKQGTHIQYVVMDCTQLLEHSCRCSFSQQGRHHVLEEGGTTRVFFFSLYVTQ